MRFSLSYLALFIFAVPALAALEFTNTGFDIVIGEPFRVTWAGATDPDPATLTLHGSAFAGGSIVLACKFLPDMFHIAMRGSLRHAS